MFRLALILVVAFCAVACSRKSESDVPARAVRIAAAASLKPVLPEVSAAFARAHPGIKVDITYGASGNFHSQLVNGARFDVFLSADMMYPQRLWEAGRAQGPPREYAAGRLVLWTHRSTGLKLESLAALSDERVLRIAIANPRHAPYGTAAETVLRNAGLLEALREKLVVGESVEQAATFVRTGAAEAGLLPQSQAVAVPMADEGNWVEVPVSLYEPIRHGAVIVKDATDPASAELFMQFLVGTEAQSIFTRGGLGRGGD